MSLSKSYSGPQSLISLGYPDGPLHVKQTHFHAYILELVAASNFSRKESIATKILVETKWLCEKFRFCLFWLKRVNGQT